MTGACGLANMGFNRRLVYPRIGVGAAARPQQRSEVELALIDALSL